MTDWTCYYCKECGYVFFPVELKEDNRCPDCGSLEIGKHESMEYILPETIREQYVFDNPLFNLEKNEQRIKSHEAAVAKVKYLDSLRTAGTSNNPKCPTCGSTSIKKISGVSKVGKVALFGIFAAGSVSKTFHCKNCSYEW